MDPFTIAGLVALVGGGFMQHQAQQAALARQQRQIRESLERQRQLQIEAENAAMRTATEFAPDDRADRQQQLQEQITTELMEPVHEAAAMREAPSVQGDVSSDYSAARARSMAEQARAAQALAQLFGRISSAGRLRQGEAIRVGDTAQQIGMLNNFSQGQRAADQIGINAAGVPSGDAMLAGTILQGLGTVGLSGGFDGLMKSSGASGSNIWSGANPVAQTNNTGLTGAGRLGFRLG